MTGASAQTSVEMREEKVVARRVDELNSLAWELRRTDARQSLSLGNEALHGARAVGYARGQAYSRLVLGYSALRASDFQAALDSLQAALEYFEGSDDKEGSRRALNTLGIVYGQSGNYVGALKTFLTLQPLCAEMGEPKSAADVLNNTGIAYFNLGDYANALSYYLRALEAFETLRHSDGEVEVLINIGMVRFERGHYEEALNAFVKAQRKDVTDSHTRALLLNHLSRTHLRLGYYEHALSYNEESLLLMNALGDRLGASYVQDDFAAIHLQHGQLEQAERCLLHSLEVKRGVGDTKGEAETCLQLGQLYLHMGRLEPALDCLHEGLASAQRSGAKVEMKKAHRALAEAYKRNRQLREACLHFELHEQLSQEVFDQASDLRLQALRVHYEVEQTEREKELYRLKNVELAQAVEALRELTASLQAANDDKAALVEALEQQSREDALTGLYNRRYADQQLARAFSQAQRYGRALSVAVCDIDHFKRVNDTFSHQMGDAVLREIAQLLRTGVRQGDTVARYGGEEFVLLLPETAAPDARRIVARILEGVARHAWHVLHPDLTVTMSAGISDDLSVQSYEKLLGRADAKLYEAKRGGRNRVRV